MSRKSMVAGIIATGGLLYVLILHLSNVDPNLIDWLVSIITGGLFILAITLDIIINYRDKKRKENWRKKRL